MVDVVVGHPERALEDQRLEHRGVEPPVRLGVVRQGGVGDRLVLEREHPRLAEMGVDVAEAHRLPVRRRELVGAVEPARRRSRA